MPPAKVRPDQDSRSDASAPKDKSAATHTTSGRGRRNGAPALANGSNLKEVISASTDTAASASRNNAATSHNNNSGISWTAEELALLHDYRTTYRLDTPAAFKNPMGHAILGRGIGKYSPTMARKKTERRVPKDQLAMAVRKNFNALAVNEADVIVDMLYKVHSQDKAFRMRFAPSRTR